MKKIIIILSAIALLGCNQMSAKQAENTAVAAVSQTDTAVNMQPLGKLADEDKICNEYEEDDGYTHISECTFKNKNLQQVYDIAKDADEHLKQELPATDIQYAVPVEGEAAEGFSLPEIEIIYKYKNQKHLLIEISYPGGETTIEIVENKNSTISKITYSAD
jgi:hypothetical protein